MTLLLYIVLLFNTCMLYNIINNLIIIFNYTYEDDNNIIKNNITLLLYVVLLFNTYIYVT